MMRGFAVAALLGLAGCPAVPATPGKSARALGDNTCEAVTWSCVGMKPGTEEAWGCTEGTDNERARFEASCTLEANGRFALNACPRDTLVGGCTIASGSTCRTTWFAAPTPASDIDSECARTGALRVAR